MFCTHCGRELMDGAKFCMHCGQMVQYQPSGPCFGTGTEGVGDSDAGTVSAPDTQYPYPEPFYEQRTEQTEHMAKGPDDGRALKIIAIVAVIAIALSAAFIMIGGGWVFEDGYRVTVVTGDHITETYGEGHYEGGTVDVIAVPEDGYCFKGWYDSRGNLVSTEPVYSFKARTVTLTAIGAEGTCVNILKGAGIETIEGGGYYEKGEVPTVTAELLTGDRFRGWYELGSDEPVSTSLTAELPEGGTRTYVALTWSDFYDGDKALEVDQSVTLSDPVWIVTDHWTGRYVGSVLGGDSLSVQVGPGRYDVTLTGYADGIPSRIHYTEVVDGSFHKEFSWKFEGRIYSISWDGEYSYIDDLHNKDVDRWPQWDWETIAFVDYTEDTVGTICDMLAVYTEHMSDARLANFVLSFVQQATAYETDDDYNGSGDYFKYPAETLYDMRGDCEDTSILYCALMKRMGYDVALCEYVGEGYEGKGHMAAAVYIESGIRGVYYEVDGKRYYYCETTSDWMKVGEDWDEYDEGDIIVIPDKSDTV